MGLGWFSFLWWSEAPAAAGGGGGVAATTPRLTHSIVRKIHAQDMKKP